MRAGKMLLGGAAGFGMGLARAMKNTSDADKANWPQWMKDMSGWKPKTVPAVDAISPVKAVTDAAPTSPAKTADGVDKSADTTLLANADNPAANSPSQFEMLAEQDAPFKDSAADTTNQDLGMDAALPSYPDDGQSADVTTSPLVDPLPVEDPTYEQASTDLGMGSYSYE